MEADYPEDPVGHTSSGFTPINKVKSEPSTSEEAVDDLKDIKQEPETEVSVSSYLHTNLTRPGIRGRSSYSNRHPQETG